jgi:hypothetical protein
MIKNNLNLILAGFCLFISGYCVGMFWKERLLVKFDYAVNLAIWGFVLSQNLLNKLTRNHR